MFLNIYRANFHYIAYFRPSDVITWLLCFSIKCKQIISGGNGQKGAVCKNITAAFPSTPLKRLQSWFK